MANQNPRVSIEEMRAKRLAREQQESAQQQPQEDTQQFQNSDPPAPILADIGDGGLPGNASLAAAFAIDKPVVPDFDDILSHMTADQLAKVRALAGAKGLAVPAAGDGAKSADGSLLITIHLDAPVTEQLEIWAEADGCTLVEEAQRRINEALENYLYGDWSTTPEPSPVAAPVAVATGAK